MHCFATIRAVALHGWTMRLAGTLVVAALAPAPPVFAQQVAARYTVPSGSMKPTILPGTVLSAFKYAPGTAPTRGDIIAFRLASEPQTTFIMRVVGLPSERLQMVNGVLQINGEPVKREPMPDFADTEDGKTRPVKRWRETLPNSVNHETLDLVEGGPFDNTAVFNVPAGGLFVLGDNRDNAQDSRLPRVGFVSVGNVVGYIKP